MKRIFINLLLFLAATPLWAQSDPEYKMEIGTGVGMMGYLGDFNESLFKDLQPMGTVLARYNLSPYMGLKMNVSFGKMKGSSADVKTYYPRFASAPYTFDNSLVDVGFAYESVLTANLPIGLGVKYKVSERMNVGLEWALHFSLSDELDGQKDPYGIKSSGLFKNTDSYSTLQLTFSYSFMAKCKTCHNEDE